MHQTKDITLTVITGGLFLIFFAIFAFMVLIYFFRRKKKLLQQFIRQESAFREARMQAELEMQEHTFRMISQEIHDNVGQLLSLAKLNFHILSRKIAHEPLLEETRKLITASIHDLRDITTGYHGNRLTEDGLIKSLQNLVESYRKNGMFQIQFTANCKQVDLSQDRLIFLYRMIQEALNNVIKHAKADQVLVRAFCQRGFLELEVADNGCGFNRHATGFKPGIGLESIHNRAGMIHAEVTLQSCPGKGTRLQIKTRL
ncbi:MAG TPA: ATP-binding protein [Sediminibacterium sp.]|nr:ATP-binding protein [Sediminibacterium sp.]